MSNHPDGIAGMDHVGIHFLLAASGIWVPVSSANPLPVATGVATTTNGDEINAVVADTVEQQLLPADANRRGFVLVNDSTGIARIKFVSAASPGNATVASMPVYRSGSWKEWSNAELEWRIYAQGNIDVKVLTYTV